MKDEVGIAMLKTRFIEITCHIRYTSLCLLLCIMHLLINVNPNVRISPALSWVFLCMWEKSMDSHAVLSDRFIGSFCMCPIAIKKASIVDVMSYPYKSCLCTSASCPLFLPS